MLMSLETEEYNASKIIVLEGSLGVRKRPAMYIGSTGSAGVLHLLFEVVDNAVDEALAGYCKNITITLSREGACDVAQISDDGRGIPIGMMPKYGKSALEVIMTTLHKGAKFNSDVYKVSGGLHGVGLTVVNALSELTEVLVKKDGHIYKQTFSKGAPTSNLELIGETTETGTTIHFKPDKEIFSTLAFDSGNLIERLRYTSFLNPGLKIILIDKRFESVEEEVFFSEKGLLDFLSFLNKGEQTLTKPLSSKKEEEGTEVEFALQYNTTYEEKTESFVNNIKTNGGGTHVSGFHSALTRAVLNYISKNKVPIKQQAKITGDDVREGLTAVLNILMQNPEFEGQTKEKLGNVKIKNIVESLVYSTLSRYLEENPSDAKVIIEKAISAASARESARKARELVRKKSIFDNTVLPGKLADCIEGNPEKTELFIVEGESAGGSSKQGRDKHIQAILPLRGKILNVEKASYDKIFENAEIKALVASIGTGIKENYNPENIRYKKIILMTDADVDGSHIRTLLLTFLYRYLRKTIEQGNVFIAQPPLYKVSKGKEIHYCYTDQELEASLNEFGDKAQIQRYKGLGEMNPEQLWETTMDPSHRVIKKVVISDAESADRLFTILMGLDIPQRRKFLQEHAEEVKSLDV